MLNTTVKALLKRWHVLLCESGINTKRQVRKEIDEVLKKIDANEGAEEAKKYKVYFKNKELREFETLKDCLNCIEMILNFDVNRFKIEDFEIYGLVESW